MITDNKGRLKRRQNNRERTDGRITLDRKEPEQFRFSAP